MKNNDSTKANERHKASLHWVLALNLVSVLSIAGCGGAPYQERNAVSQQSNSSTGSNGSGSSNWGGSDNNGSDDDSTPVDPGNTLPPITSSFTVTGAQGQTPSHEFTVTTDNLLKVKVIAGPASQATIPGSNFSASYNCVRFRVTVLGQSTDTGLLSVGNGGYACQGSPSEKTLDFSSRLTAGHGAVTIKIEATGYDFYWQGCSSYPWLYGAYPYGPYSCNNYYPTYTVFKNHTVTGTLSVQVNGTSL